MRSLSQGRVAAVFACIALLAGSQALAARTLIVCSALDDAELTRAVLEVEDAATGTHEEPGYADLRVSHLEIVTPEFVWSAPGQPETRRFAAAQSDVSPDLAQLDTVAIHATRGKEGVLRIVDFVVLEPDALELEGLRGSLMLHETWQVDRAIASLYYTYTGNRVIVAALSCRRFEED